MILLLLACAGPDYRAADLQLDVAAALPEGAETLRVCVEGWGVYEVGAGNGRAAVAGLVVDDEYTVTVDVNDAAGGILAQSAPTVLGLGATWTTAPLQAPLGACEAEGEPASAGEDSWLLAVRFDEDATPWDQP